MNKVGSRRLTGLPDAGPGTADLALRTTPSAFLYRMYDSLGRPAWQVAGTSLAERQDWPDQITVADYVQMVGNLVACGPDPAYHLEYLRSGVPLFYGALDSALQYAPTLADAFELMERYASDRPGTVAFVRLDEEGRSGLELVPRLDLGAAHGLLVETPMLQMCRMVARYMGRKALGTRLTFAYPPPVYAAQLAELAQADIAFNARRTTLLVPREVAAHPNIAFDTALWRAASESCLEDHISRIASDPLAAVKSAFDVLLANEGVAPQLRDCARVMGVSPRTMLRLLGKHGMTFTRFREIRTRPMLEALLADRSLPIEEIAGRMGYADPSGLHRTFKRRYGQTPGRFRRQSAEPRGD